MRFYQIRILENNFIFLTVVNANLLLVQILTSDSLDSLIDVQILAV